MNASKLGPATAIAVAGLLLGACAAQPQPICRADAVPDRRRDTRERSRNRTVTTRSVSCLRSSAYTKVEVINPELLLFHGRGERMWLNRMRQACVGLHLDDALAFEMRNSRLCELDTVRGIDNFGGYWSATGAGCSLGSFDPRLPRTGRPAQDPAFEQLRPP